MKTQIFGQFLTSLIAQFLSTEITLFDHCLRICCLTPDYPTILWPYNLPYFLHVHFQSDLAPSWQDSLTTTQSVCEFTLTEFSKRKQFSNHYYSPPFYTHPQGYKLCLIVYANGGGIMMRILMYQLLPFS